MEKIKQDNVVGSANVTYCMAFQNNICINTWIMKSRAKKALAKETEVRRA